MLSTKQTLNEEELDILSMSSSSIYTGVDILRSDKADFKSKNAIKMRDVWSCHEGKTSVSNNNPKIVKNWHMEK